MSENGDIPTGDGIIGGMRSADVKFLVTCLQNCTGGSVSIDTTKVAELLGYTNVRSVVNKLNVIKKKYDLPIGGSAGKGSGTPNKSATTTKAVVPKTPTKNRVTKSRTTSSTRKKATGTPKTKVESNDEETMKVAESDEAAEPSQDDYEKVFGKPDSDAEADGDEA